MLTLIDEDLMTKDDMAAASEAELVQAARKIIAITAKHLLYVAQICFELKRRGQGQEFLDELASSKGWKRYMLHMAEGKVVPEAVMAFVGKKTVFDKIMLLPADEQKRLAEGGSVLFVVRDGSGFTNRMLRAIDMDSRSLLQVLDDGVIRTEQAQIAFLCKLASQLKPSQNVKSGNVRIIHDAGVMKIGNSTADIADVVEALQKGGYIKT